METLQSFIDSLNRKEYKELWSKFWVHELGYDPNAQGFSKVAVKLSKEEAREKDVILEKNFLHFVKTNYNK